MHHAQIRDYPDPYSEKLILNPAYTGLNNCKEITLNYKINNFEHVYSASYNQKLQSARSGIAFLLVNNNQANKIINNFYATGIYAFKIIDTENRILNTAFNISYYQQNINTSGLVFSNQIDPLNGMISPFTSEYEFPTYRSVNFSTGLAYLSTKIRTGFSVLNIESFFFKNSNYQLNPVLNIHFGKIFSVYSETNNSLLLIPEIIYKNQRNFHQIIYGIHLIYNKILTKVYVKHNLNLESASPSVTLAYDLKKFRISYSYEINIHKYIALPVHQNQINLMFNLDCKEKRKNKNTIYCSNF